MTPGVERDDPGGIAPLRKRADRLDRCRVGEIRDVDRAELAGGDRQRPVERIGAVMRPDDVAPLLARGADDRAARGSIGRPPDDGLRVAAGGGMRGKYDVLLQRAFDRKLRSTGVLAKLTEWASFIPRQAPIGINHRTLDG